MTVEERLEVPLEVKGTNDENGTFEGYGSTFGNMDSDKDIVAAGAFAESLAAKGPKKVKLLWQHDRRQPIGVYEQISEDGKGLFVKGRLLHKGVRQAAEAYELLKAGALDSLSIGFRTLEDTWDRDSGVRTITKTDLMEISLVTFPANDQATIHAVKAADRYPTIKHLETALRDELGFSHRESRKAAPDLWRLVSDRDDQPPSEDESSEELVSALKGLTDNLQSFGK